MPEQNKPETILQLPGSVMEKSESPSEVQTATEEFRTVPNDAVEFRKVPQAAERKENHTMTVRELARLFESAGVARTERSIINWCQPNRHGIARLDSYFDPNERKYYITPQSVEAVIQEEIQRAKKSGEATNSEVFGSAVTHVKHSPSPINGTTAETRRIEQLERELNDSKLSNQVKDLFIELLKNERAQVFEKFLPANHPASLLDSKENQPEGANK